jgi:hypothetical protein
MLGIGIIPLGIEIIGDFCECGIKLQRFISHGANLFLLSFKVCIIPKRVEYIKLVAIEMDFSRTARVRILKQKKSHTPPLGTKCKQKSKF